MDPIILRIVMWVAAIVTAVLAVVTLLPSPKASKKNMIGFKSVCSLTPVSTAIMAIVIVGLVIIAFAV